MQAHRAAWPWAGLWLSAALLLAACSAAPTGRADRASARTAAAELATPPARSQPQHPAQVRQVQYRCDDGQQLQVRYEHQGGRPAGRAIVEFAGQRIAMQHVEQALQPHYVAQAQSTQQASYRWHAGQGDGAGGLSIRAAGSAAMEVPLLQGCQRATGASGAPGAPQE
ncbi:hypothetical protein CLI92_04370 [Vandammella animalimorsus]|uniref:C-type lysozyme inhibitor domain-containing protein n=2 Tax=Vandammella animalimorsus TaxID=2029117 RepID=A0A2A2T7G3_9BURK|nr:hypothetical protein CLI92_04370 [Vandammella animalimorsus]PAX19414.1 hypothetical protein CLI93_07220 [Vandammella animalimorsus]